MDYACAKAKKKDILWTWLAPSGMGEDVHVLPAGEVEFGPRR